MAPGGDTMASPRLRRLAQRLASAAPQVEEHCEMCDAPIAPEHRHLIDLETRELLCACRACSLLFDRAAAGGGHFRLVPDRRLRLDDFELSDLTWERLRIPVDMAFFFRSSRDERVLAFYPSPMGATESLLEPDVEALLVDRSRGARRQWLVPVDACYALVGLIRTRWKGLSGGKEVWQEIDRFFEELDRQAKPRRQAAAEGS